MVRTIAEAEQRIRLLETENQQLRREVHRQQQITVNVLDAVSEYGAATASARAAGLGPGDPNAITNMLGAVANLWLQRKRRPFLERAA